MYVPGEIAGLLSSRCKMTRGTQRVVRPIHPCKVGVNRQIREEIFFLFFSLSQDLST